MEKRTRFNLLYLVLTLAAVSLLQYGWQQAQTVEIVPYSDFEAHLAEGRFSEITVGEDRFLMTREELENKMAVLLGGRAAEQVAFGRVSTGAADDLAKVANIARSMVVRYGMVEALGALAYEEPPSPMLGDKLFPRRREYSEHTAHQIDVAVRDIVEAAYNKAFGILSREKSLLEHGARLLLQKETLAEAELAELRLGLGLEKAA